MQSLAEIKTTNNNFIMDGYILIHRAMNQDVANLAQVARRLTALTREEINQLNHWFSFEWEMIEKHHLEEDEHLFPDVGERASLQGLEVLTADHHELDNLVGEIGDNFKQLRTADFGPAYGDLCFRQSQLIGSFSTKLTAHLEREEAVIIPAIALNFEAAEQQILEAGARKRMPTKHLSKLVPWVLSSLSPQEEKEALKELPLPFRLLYRYNWKKRYQEFASVIKIAQER
jgi:zinc finger-like protein